MVGKTIFLLVVLVGVACAVTPQCTFGNLDFNPWDRWNVFAFNDIGSSANPYGADFEGRAAAGGSIYLDEFTLRMLSGGSSDTTPWSGTAGQDFIITKGDVNNGGVEAGNNVFIGQGSVDGDATAVAGTLTVSAGGTVTGTASAKPGKLDIQGSAGAQNPSNSLSLSVDLDDVKAYFLSASAGYAALDDSVGGVVIDGNTNGKITVTLNPGLNVVRLTNAQLENASNLILLGDSTGFLVINIDSVAASFTNLDVYADAGLSTKPTSGRVLINFHAATTLGMGPISAHASILAPNADLSYWSGVITGNVVVKSLVAVDGSGTGAQINIQHWVHCPPPATPPAPGTTGEIPSPPEECPPCPWEELGYNPWDLWNVFSLGNVGTSGKPFTSDFQGRLAAVGSVWFKSFSLHDIAQAATSVWSATVGGDFSLNGGSVSNGGVEAGGNVNIFGGADVAGDVKSVGGNIVLGNAISSTTVGGIARAAGTVTINSGSAALDGFVEGDNSLSLSVDLTAAANWFKQQSLAYASESDNVVNVIYSPSQANPTDITVELGAGFNYLTLTAAQLLSASRLQLTGDATGVLVINVAGASVQFDNLDVTVNGWVDVPTWGRVLINFYEATSLTVESGHGHLSILAPLANVLYKSGLFTGSWVVGSLVSEWEGGTQINVQPWTPPCPPCPPGEVGGKAVKTAKKSQQKKFVASRRVNVQTTQQAQQFAQQSHQGVPQWALILGGGVAGIALSALVVAGIALRKLSNLPRAVGRKNIVPATPSQANIFSPQSSSSLSHRGRGQFPTSP